MNTAETSPESRRTPLPTLRLRMPALRMLTLGMLTLRMLTADFSTGSRGCPH
ncbi:hypothetical protein [Leifsonia sp. NPDC058248]|uniref:hypothetical protein n=1 Tax=Leifsonia sp. NPDC058248 TaxID=3346402 RepID=UPI0036DD6591